MGYTTEFKGSFKFDRPIEEAHAAYIRAFNNTRRMKRDASIASRYSDPIRVNAGLPIGDDAAYFVGGSGFHGQGNDASVLDHNTAPGQQPLSVGNFDDTWSSNAKLSAEGKCQPGLWCHWTIGETGDLEWDGGEKFYNYTEWLKYLIEHFFKRWGYVLNGEVKWEGEDREDVGIITVSNNIVTAHTA